jgi:hypothetical protein
LIGHDNRTTPIREDPTENEHGLSTPATNNKQIKVAQNEPNQPRLNRQLKSIIQGSDDDIDIGDLATGRKDSKHTDE